MLLTRVQASSLLRIVVGIGATVWIGAAPLGITLSAQEGKDAHGDSLPAGALMRLGTSRFRHGGSIYSLAYSADGRYLVTGNAGRRTLLDDASVAVWDADTGQRVQTWFGHAHVVRSVTFSPDSKRVVVVNGYGKVRLYDVPTGKELWRPETESPEQALFSPDGAILLVSDIQNVRRWDATTGKELPPLRGHQKRIYSFAIAANGKTMATWGSDGIMCLWGADGRERRRIVIPKEFSLGIALSPDGKRLACGTAESALRLLDTDSGRELWRVKTEEVRIGQQAFSPDGKTTATAGQDSTVALWETLTAKQRQVFTGHAGRVSFVAFSPDAKRLASGGEDHTALIWDLTAGSAKNQLTPKECDALWSALSGTDAAKAYRAIWQFAADPERAIPCLQARLRPVPPVERERLARLITELDSERYAVRQQATRDLEAIGEQAIPALRQIPLGKATLEFRRRVENLLVNLRTQPPPAEQLRQLRAIEILEHVGTAEARQVLRSLAQGAPEAHVTQDAKAALDRLSGQGMP